MWVGYVFPLVARDEHELEWMAKGFVLDRPYQFLNIPRLFGATVRYELLMRDDEARRLFYWYKDMLPFVPVYRDEQFLAAITASEGLSDPDAALAEPQPLAGIPLPTWRFAPNFSSESRVLP